MSIQIKLENEGSDEELETDVLYSPQIALKLALTEWLSEFRVPHQYNSKSNLSVFFFFFQLNKNNSALTIYTFRSTGSPEWCQKHNHRCDIHDSSSSLLIHIRHICISTAHNVTCNPPPLLGPTSTPDYKSPPRGRVLLLLFHKAMNSWASEC